MSDEPTLTNVTPMSCEPALHGDARFQILVEERVVAVGWFLDGEGPNRLPIEQHQQLVRTVLAQPADGSGQIASEQDLDDVLAVLGKRI